MRKLKLQMQMSLDGFVSTGPNDDQSWVTWALDDIKPHVLELLEGIDTILIGRKLAIDYIPYWQEVSTKHDHPMHDIAEKIVAARKIVFSKSVADEGWENTEISTGHLIDKIHQLKNTSGKDMIVYGGSSFVGSLFKEGLIDEFHFFVNPVVLGKGDSIFDRLENVRQLNLLRSIIYPSGIVMLQYEQNNSPNL